MRTLVWLLALALLTPQTAPTPGAALQLLAQGDAVGAAAMLAEVTAADPDDGRAWMLLSTARQRSGDLAGAVAAARRAVQLGQGPAASYRLGLALAASGARDAAFETLRHVKQTGAFDMTRLGTDPDAGAVRDDDRYAGLLPTAAEFDDPFVEPVRVLGEWRGEVEGGQYGWIAREVGDVDSDGIRDFTTSAPTDGNGGTVFTYSSGTRELLWQVSGEEGSQLGSGLEAAGDVDADGVPDVIAGAPTGDYALVLSGNDGREILRLEPDGEQEGFGTQVGDLGDVNGDGHADVLVGAPTADHGGEDSGRLYLFSGADGTVLWTADGRADGERLGSTVAGGTVGGRSWIVGGADQGPGAGGIAYVWRELADSPAFVMHPRRTAAAFGGMFASVPGDVDGDGQGDIYVSDWADGEGGPQTGRIYVASGATGQQILTIGGEASGDGFGIGPADAGDVDGDGHADLIVGAWQQASAAPSGGKIYLYSGRSGELLWQVTGKVMGETFGFDATGIGDVDGDGAIDFLLTSAWSSVNGPRTGRVYILAGPQLR
jgi:hypothetical protein